MIEYMYMYIQDGLFAEITAEIPNSMWYVS